MHFHPSSERIGQYPRQPVNFNKNVVKSLHLKRLLNEKYFIMLDTRAIKVSASDGDFQGGIICKLPDTVIMWLQPLLFLRKMYRE